MKSIIPKSVKGMCNKIIQTPILLEHGVQTFCCPTFLISEFLQILASPEAEKARHEEDATGGAGVNENESEDDEERTIYPYERLITTADDPAPDIDVTKREVSN